MVENGVIAGQGTDFEKGEYITVSVRPEKIRFETAPAERFTLRGIVRDYIYVGSVVKCIAVLPNGNELKMEKLAGEKLPQIGEQVFPCWDPKDAVLIHSQSHIVYQAMENVVLK